MTTVEPWRTWHEPGWATPELELSPGRRPPAVTPAPPWRTRIRATLWWHRATLEALEALPEQLRGRRAAALTVAATISYEQSPVGPYEEVLGAPHLLLPTGLLDVRRVSDLIGVHVPFIAVDSLASLVGGRQHWGLPKTYATLTRTGDRVVATGGQGPRSWRVAADPSAAGPRVPVAGAFSGVQLGRHGLVTARSRVRGSARPARVNVEVATGTASEPGSIGGWLRPGHHPGLVLRGRLTVGAALPTP